MIVYSKRKLVYRDKNIEVFLEKNKLFFSKNNKTNIIEIPCNPFWKLFFNSKLLLRLFRIDIRCFEKLGDNYYFFFKKNLYCVQEQCSVFKLVFLKHFEMSSPLYFAKSIDDQSILFGDYTNNKEKKEVRIYSITKDNSINVLFCFKPGLIKHIHNIIPSKDKDYYWILTGDSDSESGIWKLYKNNSISIFAGPSQFFRSCFICETEEHLYFLTDSPIVDNYICALDKLTKRIVFKVPIPGPCIFARRQNDIIIFSTSVEPNPDKKSLFNNFKKSKVIHDKSIHIFKFTMQKNILEEIFAIEKDFHNMKYFGFGNASIFLDSNAVYITPVAVKKYSFKTLKIDYE